MSKSKPKAVFKGTDNLSKTTKKLSDSMEKLGVTAAEASNIKWPAETVSQASGRMSSGRGSNQSIPKGKIDISEQIPRQPFENKKKNKARFSKKKKF